MILLDENISKDQRELLQAWNIKAKQISIDVGIKGISDENIIALLHQFKGVLFLSRDSDFWNKSLCHLSYCLVYLDVERDEAAFFIRKFLKHEAFDTVKKRLGKVVKVSQMGLSYYEVKKEGIKAVKWK